MTRRLLAAIVALLLTLSFGSARAEGPESYAFAFRDAEISVVVQEVLGQAGVPYVLDPAVTGKITLRIEQRLTRDQLVAALEAALEAHGVSVVRKGEQVSIIPQARARSSAGIRMGVEGAGEAGYEIVAVPLSYSPPTEVARALEAISDVKTVLYADDKLGLLLLAGSGQQLKASLDTLKVFDQNAFRESKIRWFELAQAQALTVAGELERIIQGSGATGINVVPLKRLNGVIVFAGSTEALEEVAKWVARLDTPGKEVAFSLWVYRPRNTAAESLARTLNSVMGLQTRVESVVNSPGPAGAASISPPPTTSTSMSTSVGGLNDTDDEQVRVGVDKDTNTLLIFASPPRWIQIQRILNEIDRPARQIFIEASILEVTLTDEFQFGVDWAVFAKDFAISSVNNATGAIGSAFPGASITYLSDDIEAAVRALGSRTTIEVVSAPKIIALDNRTARLQIGDQVPVVTQSSQSTTAPGAAVISSVDYRSTGVILTVTPRITGENQLMLEVSQEVSTVSKTATSGIDSPTIQQRRFESALILRDGGVVALGGLINANTSKGRSGVPWLKDVPGVGALFRSEGRSNNRSELIVLLSARIISDAAGADRALVDLAADMRELQARGLLPVAP